IGRGSAARRCHSATMAARSAAVNSASIVGYSVNATVAKAAQSNEPVRAAHDREHQRVRQVSASRQPKQALSHRVRKRFQQPLAVFPTDAAVGNAESVHQGFARKMILSTGEQVALGHYAYDARITSGDLPCNVATCLHLLLELLRRVGVTQV